MGLGFSFAAPVLRFVFFMRKIAASQFLVILPETIVSFPCKILSEYVLLYARGLRKSVLFFQNSLLLGLGVC